MDNSTTADQIILKHSIYAAGAGLIPIPLLDLVAVFSIQMRMLRKLADKFGQDFEEVRSKAILASLAGTVAARVGSRIVKAIPILGSFFGGLALAMFASGATYAMGKYVIGHFEDATPEDPTLNGIPATEAGPQSIRIIDIEITADAPIPKYRLNALRAMLAEGRLTRSEYELAEKYYRTMI